MAPRRVPNGPFDRSHEHIAAALQATFEVIVFHVLSHWAAVTGERSLAMAGGTAQNSTCNGRILASGLFDRVFVQPAAHDAGIALGAALQVRALEADAPRSLRCSHVYWGPDLPHDAALERILAGWREFIDVARCAEPAAEAARHLAAGEVIGWVQGRSEFGPRALGNRSILADPRPVQNRERINAVVKARESYRPFAPAVIKEHAADFFEIPASVPSLAFMTFVVPVRPDAQRFLGAVTHVDGTARVQTVERWDNEMFWQLLVEFERLAGIPMLLNTSFNNNAEPIVDSVEDAMACFLTSGLDRLVVGHYCAAKRRLPSERWLSLVPRVRSDGIIARYCAKDAPGQEAPVYAIIVRNWEAVRISRPLFRLLSEGQGEPATRLLDVALRGEPTTAAELGAEMFDLWSRRLVSLQPSASPCKGGDIPSANP
jgi:carbamoyltransferase